MIRSPSGVMDLEVCNTVVHIAQPTELSIQLAHPYELIFSLDIWLFHSRTLCYQVYVIQSPFGSYRLGRLIQDYSSS